MHMAMRCGKSQESIKDFNWNIVSKFSLNFIQILIIKSMWLSFSILTGYIKKKEEKGNKKLEQSSSNSGLCHFPRVKRASAGSHTIYSFPQGTEMSRLLSVTVSFARTQGLERYCDNTGIVISIGTFL